MSGSINSGLTPSEVVAVRRYCGYPPGSRVIGIDIVGSALAVLAAEEIAVLRTVFLAALATLEAAVPAAGDNLDADTAAIWTRNKREVADREDLLRDWRIKTCMFLGIDSGPFLGLMITGAFVV